MKDHFKDKAEIWDAGEMQVKGAKKIADAITKEIKLTNNMELLDFGVGTGLLGFDIAKNVKKVYGVDTSPKMIEKLQEKNTSSLYIETYTQDIVLDPLDRTFDGVISSMTLHHVENLKLFFETIYKNINSGGFIAIADLETEDGTFHSDNTGVFHFGFDKVGLVNIAKDAGFFNIKFENINTINKPDRDFGVFLLTAQR
ncbi:class I SAM-dependent DNA methyltransferase [Candidatus Sulfurimonas baltica]|uniref:Class I SAM-dependent methyltransferase n=1 Tax=Candidatus Sulfurimonas baltica TaxID=2740404 RepID=A0A7S7LT76_9BACT|nr:class I SAM-dependent methyltransferase [Candidatus Sulfurimonas baltica]QOY51099.1 class I SAM-dependent methyltransferase [Candidatus Sulfurimonas baltica]